MCIPPPTREVTVNKHIYPNQRLYIKDVRHAVTSTIGLMPGGELGQFQGPRLVKYVKRICGANRVRLPSDHRVAPR